MDMSTTVEVKRNTAKVLEELKRKYGARSMDETVRRLIDKAENIPDTMFGAHPKMKPFSPSDEAEFHDL
jgi:hypothetical protein